jgi:hypothetical protein
VADQYTAGQLLVPVKPDARGAATRVRREFETMREPTVRIDVDIRDLEKKIGAEQAKLDKLQARKVSPKLDLDIAEMNAKLAQAQARLDELRRKPTSAKVDADVAAAEVKVQRISHSLEVLHQAKANPQIDLDIANADAKLAGMRAKLDQLRAERVQVAVDADTAGATTKLTGFRAMAGRLVGTVQSRVDVDTSGAIVQIAALSRALGTLAMPAAIIGATPFLASLGDSARDAAGAVWLMPAAMSAGAISIGALKTATAGVGDAMKYAFDPEQAEKFQEALAKLSPQAQQTVLSVQGLAPQLTAVRTASQDALFNGLGPLVTRLADPYLPMASTTFSRIAGSVNASAHAFGNYLASSTGIGQVQVIADGTALSFGNVMAAVSPLAQAFVNIAAIGMPVLVQLTGGAEGVAQRFATWTSSAQGINTITAWIWNAIVTLQQLWQLAVNVGSILGSVFDAGAASGESFLGVLVRITGSLAATLRTPEGAAGLQSFFTSVRGLAQGFVDKLVILWPAVVAFAQALGAVLAAGGPLLGVLLQLVVTALVPLLNVVTALSPILGPMVAAIVAIRVATAVWAGVQWALNAALTANPIGLVIVAIAALVAGVIYAYQNFEWFRNIVDGAWRGIAAAASWAWNTILKPYLSALWAEIQTVGRWMSWLWTNIVVPAWNGIAAAVSWAWTNIIQPIWNALVTVAQFIGSVISWLWTTIFVPAWNGIAAAVQWAWVNIIQPVWTAIDTVARYIAAIIMTVLLVAFRAAWEGISLAVSIAWNNIIKPIWDLIVWSVQTILAPTISWLWNNVFVPAWNGIGFIISTVWNTIILPLWNALVGFVNTIMIPAIMWLWNNVFVPAWNGIGFIISTVWNTIILPIWNGLVGFVNNIMIPAIMWLWNNVMVPAWNGIAAAIRFVWDTIILPVWNALVGFINNVIIPATNFLYHNVIKPVWDAIGASIDWVWRNVIQPAWQAVSDGLAWLGERFREGVDRIGQLWNGLRRMLAAPVNFLINTVWNNGIVRAWNEVSRLVGLPPVGTLAGIPEYATGGTVDATRGGALRGPGGGTDDKMLARVSNGEYVVRADVARQHRHFLDALNSGQPEARQAAGGRFANPPGYAVGGMIDRAKDFARSMAGKPYVWGGAGPGGSDCSGFMSQITNVLRGQNPHSRLGTTSTMPWPGFRPGLASAFSIGNTKNAGRGIGHMAGTLGGENVESGSGHGPMIGGRALGANAGMFNAHFHLPEAGGQFVGGAGGGGGGAAPVDTITPQIHAAYARYADPVVRRFNQDNELGPTGKINPNRRLPPGYGTLDRESTIKRLLDEAAKQQAAAQAAGAGGPAVGDVSGLSARQREAAGTIIGVAKSRGMPRKAAEIGVAVAMQESKLGTIGYGRAVDHDSLGLFQQRPSMGWGTPAQVQNDVYASNKFFDGLAGVNYMGMSHTAAGQAVQRSAYPNAYAQWVPMAISAVNAFPGGYDRGGLALGRGIMLKQTMRPERVLDPVETRQYDTLGPLVREMEAGRPPGGPTVTLSSAQLAAMTAGSGLSGPVRITGVVQTDLANGVLEFVDAQLEMAASSLDNVRQV